MCIGIKTLILHLVLYPDDILMINLRYPYITILFLFFALCCYCSITSCKKQEPITVTTFLPLKLPLLDRALPDSSVLRTTLSYYAYTLYKANEIIDKEEDLAKMFETRDTLLYKLHHELLDSLSADYSLPYFNAQANELDNELALLGMKAVYSERIYVGLEPIPMLQFWVRRYGYKPFPQYVDFLNQGGISEGGYDYPYIDLKKRMEMVSIGEQMRKDYPESIYSKKIEPYFADALNSLVDIHSVLEFDTTATTIIGALNTESYPTGTDTFYHTWYVKNHAKSKYTPVVSRILDNISTIQLNYYFLPRDVYMIVTDWYPYVVADNKPIFTPADTLLTCCPTALQQRNNYIEQGVDVPHVVVVYNGKQKMCALVYRFYGSKTLAEDNLAKAHQAVGRDVMLVTIKCDIAHYLQNPKWTIIGVEQGC